MEKNTPLDVPSTIQQRRSIRAFKPDPIEPALIRQLINLAVLAPSSSNLQPWRIILIQNPEKKAALTQVCFNEEVIASAPIIFVFAADINAWNKDLTLRVDLAKQNKAYPGEEIKYFKKAVPHFFGRLGDKTREYAVKEAMISATHLVLAAESLGLSTCFINGWLEYQVKEVIDFLFGYQLDISIIKLQVLMRNTIFLITAIITWKSITMDYDVVAEEKNIKERILLIILTISLYFYPILLLPYLFVSIHFFKAWLIHTMLPIRILKMFVSYLGALVVVKHLTLVEKIDSADTFVPFILLMLCVQASHYFIPGVSKLKLGNKWNSWILENKTHYLMISAYNWGWLQFLPERLAVNTVNRIKNYNQIINSCTIILQCGLFALMVNSSICLLLLTGCTLLNIAIFFATGLCFWEYALTNTLIIVLISNLSNSISTTLFSPLNWLVYLLILSLSLNGKVWTPYSMSWWDTPFIGKVHWRVVGKSGKIYELYNNFMCPYEELYGHEYGWFLVDSKIIYENHLGIWKYNKEVRDKIIASKGDLQILSNLQNQFGKSYRDFEKEREHEAFLIKFFTKLNGGFEKNVLPSWLKWLKAPGGYFFYWGEYPAYSRQEPVSRVLIYYVEKFFDDRKVKIVVNEIVKMVEIPSSDNITT